MNKSSGFLPKAATFALWCLAACLAGVALRAPAQPEVYGNPDSSAFIRIPKDADDWTRHFHLGGLVGMNISASFNLSGSALGISGSDPARGIFDDGYVHPDQTGDPNYTGNWGYKDTSQYNAASQELTMHATTSFSTTSPGAGNANVDGDPFPGIDLAYGDNLWYWKHARVGWELGFDWLPISITDNHPFNVQARQYSYVYSVGDIVMPGAPYQGGPGGQGEPIIPGSYDPAKTSYQDFSGTVTGSRTLDVSLYALRLGPSFYWDLTDHVGLSLGAGPSVGIVTGKYKFDEIVTVNGVPARNSGQFSGTKLVYGGYVNATVLCHVQNNADIFVGAQYTPMTDATIGGGGREGRLKLGGQLYLTVGLSWPF